MKDLAQALIACDSAASHTDPHLRDIAWNRENAVLALGTAVSLAQLILARTDLNPEGRRRSILIISTAMADLRWHQVSEFFDPGVIGSLPGLLSLMSPSTAGRRSWT